MVLDFFFVLQDKQKSIHQHKSAETAIWRDLLQFQIHDIGARYVWPRIIMWQHYRLTGFLKITHMYFKISIAFITSKVNSQPSFHVDTCLTAENTDQGGAQGWVLNFQLVVYRIAAITSFADFEGGHYYASIFHLSSQY